MSRWMLVATILALGLVVDAQATPVIAGDAPVDCAQATPSAPPQPPQVPPDAELLRGEVTLIVSLDRCGRAVDVQVEKSSGDRRLDDAAVTAARTWHLPPQTNAQGTAVESRVRIPVKFDPDIGGPDPKATSRSRPRDEFFVARRAMKAKSPARLGDGRIPGFVADEYPIGVDSVEQAEAMLVRYGDRQADVDQSIRQYDVIDEEGMSYWYLIHDPTTDGKAVFRQRAVSDGEHGFWVTSSLCLPVDSPMCRHFQGYLAAFEPQKDMPPPPPPPPPKPENR